jgi:hypothetical protein
MGLGRIRDRTGLSFTGDKDQTAAGITLELRELDVTSLKGAIVEKNKFVQGVCRYNGSLICNNKEGTLLEVDLVRNAFKILHFLRRKAVRTSGWIFGLRKAVSCGSKRPMRTSMR